jgi:hypothetical protein
MHGTEVVESLVDLHNRGGGRLANHGAHSDRRPEDLLVLHAREALSSAFMAQELNCAMDANSSEWVPQKARSPSPVTHFISSSKGLAHVAVADMSCCFSLLRKCITHLMARR